MLCPIGWPFGSGRFVITGKGVMSGHLALVGGSEWNEGCDFDVPLLAASGGTEVAVLATAAAFENPSKRVARAEAWFATLGATVRAIPVYDRSGARDPEHVRAVRDAAFLYLGDGSSQHLRSVLLDTPLWSAIVETWQGGAVLAASAQAATALCDHMVDARGGAFTVGLGLLSDVTVIPHYDLWSPDKWHRTVKLARPDLVVAGVDERTALIRHPDETWSIGGAGTAALYRAGKQIELDEI
jgi:cyanophycinase